MTSSRSSGNIRSTDRGGAVTLTAGILSLALGFGLLIGITLQTTAHTVVMFKDMALGLGGVLYHATPFFFFWMGWLLCISARHYVSFRSFVITFILYMSLLALLTMLTSVTGFGTLIDYISRVNPPDSYGGYLTRSYQRYNNQLNPLPGGGAMGMLVAFPVSKILGQVGGVIFLIISMIILVFALFRINPVLIYQRFESFMQRGQSERPDTHQPVTEPVSTQEQAVQQDPQAQGNYEPRTEPYFVEPQAGPFQSHYNQNSVSPAGSYAPIVEQPVMYDRQPEEEGFTAVKKDFYEAPEEKPAFRPFARKRPESIAQQPSGAQASTRALASDDSSSGFTEVKESSGTAARESISRHDPDKRVSTSQPFHVPAMPASGLVRQAPVQSDEPYKGQPAAAHDTFKETHDEPLIESVSPSVQDGGTEEKKPSASVEQIREVGIAPAVALTGKRVAVKPSASSRSDAGQDRRTPVKPVAKQTSMQIDSYQRPGLSLISAPPPDANVDTTQEDQAKAEKLISTLDSFNISATVNQVVHGPAVTSFGIRLAEGVNINKLRNVMDNISVELLAKSPARAEIPIPGTPLIGIEVSNDKASTVYLSEILSSPKMREMKSPTAVALGKDIYGSPVICELMDMPHLLIAGATGSGKSVCINSIITSLLYRSTPREVRLILIDPKFVELQPYNEGPHLLLPVVVDPKKAVMALEWVCQEMDERYKALEKYRVRNIDAYNAKLPADEEPMPRIVVIVDEMADLMLTAGKAIDEHIKRITAKARAAGICLILATQRPSVDVITGVIKANIPSRIAFQVSSQIDSRTILDSQGAEKLLGYGDMLYFPRTLKAPKRVQGCFISDADVARVADNVKSRNRTEYNTDIMEHIEKEEKKEAGGGTQSSGGTDGEDSFDELLPKAIEMAVEAGQMSISMLQRVLRIGYGRAGRLIDEMSRRNIISGNEGTKPRKTLISREQYRDLFEDEASF